MTCSGHTRVSFKTVFVNTKRCNIKQKHIIEILEQRNRNKYMFSIVNVADGLHLRNLIKLFANTKLSKFWL